MIDVRMPDGTLIRNVPEGTTKEELLAKINNPSRRLPYSLRHGAPPAANPDTGVGGAEVAATLLTAPFAEVAGGLSGIGAAVVGGPKAGANAVNSVRDALTYRPRTEKGRAKLAGLAETIQPATDALMAAENAAGEYGYQKAGPIGGAIGKTLPTAAVELASLGAGRLAGAGHRAASATPDARSAKILDSGRRFDVPVMTTDVKPPKSYFGRFVQGLSEKLGPFGTGGSRVYQQGQREAALRGFAEQFDIDLDSDFARDIVASIDNTLKGRISEAGKMRTEAVAVLDAAGEVPLRSVRRAVTTIVERHTKLKKKGNPSIVESAKDTLDSLEGGNFTQLKNIRTELITEIQALKASGDTRGLADLQRLKSAIDKDMLHFARRTDKNAARGWVRSNQEFADAYTKARDSELKRLLMHGELTPEKALTVIRGGKRSELARMRDSMDASGREAVRKAILQDALKDSKYFEVDANPNPDAFVNAMNRPNRRQAVDVFFSGVGRKEIDGLTRLLDATRRAQSGAAFAKTGEQIIPGLAIGGSFAGVQMAPVETISAVVGVSALIKAYESKAFRSLLLKLSNTQRGTKAERQYLDLAATTFAAELQAAKEAQEETEQ